MKSYEEIISMFELGDEKVYFNSKGKVKAEDLTIEEDYTWSECGGMLYGSELDCYIVLKDGEELSLDEYKKFSFSYNDKTEKFNESGEKYGKCKSKRYFNSGIDLSGCEVYVLHFNFNNNIINSCIIDIYEIE